MSYIKRQDLDKLLHQVPDIKDHEREYFKGLCESHFVQSDGLREDEAHKIIQQIKNNPTDAISSFRAEQISKALSEHYKKV
jgi:hypothetical protein